jgi:hypothetical protein
MYVSIFILSLGGQNVDNMGDMMMTDNDTVSI